jgi:hypothetical protein
MDAGCTLTGSKAEHDQIETSPHSRGKHTGIIHLRTFLGPCNAPIRFKKSMNTADVMNPLFVGPPECSCHTDVMEFYIQNLPSFHDVRA